MVETEANPGSAEAVQSGCLCPVIDNHHGRGMRDDGKQFVLDSDCPLHGSEVADGFLRSVRNRDTMSELHERLMEYEAANSRVWQTLKAVFPIGAKVFVTQDLRSLTGCVESYVADAPDRLLISFSAQPAAVVFLSRIRLAK